MCCCPSCEHHSVTDDMLFRCERDGCAFAGSNDEACSIESPAFRHCTAKCATTGAPTAEPTKSPTSEPTEGPTDEPTNSPTDEPTPEPTPSPTMKPTHICPIKQEMDCCCPDCEHHEVTEHMLTICERDGCQFDGSGHESSCYSAPAFRHCTAKCARTASPTAEPTDEPTESPTPEPTKSPTAEPTPSPTMKPTHICPIKQEKMCCCPSCEHHSVTDDMLFRCERDGCAFTGSNDEACSIDPPAFRHCTAKCATTGAPTAEPTKSPTSEPTDSPTDEPTDAPTAEPSPEPTPAPTKKPTHICPIK